MTKVYQCPNEQTQNCSIEQLIQLPVATIQLWWTAQSYWITEAANPFKKGCQIVSPTGKHKICFDILIKKISINKTISSVVSPMPFMTDGSTFNQPLWTLDQAHADVVMSNTNDRHVFHPTSCMYFQESSLIVIISNNSNRATTTCTKCTPNRQMHPSIDRPPQQRTPAKSTYCKAHPCIEHPPQCASTPESTHRLAHPSQRAPHRSQIILINTCWTNKKER